MSMSGVSHTWQALVRITQVFSLRTRASDGRRLGAGFFSGGEHGDGLVQDVLIAPTVRSGCGGAFDACFFIREGDLFFSVTLALGGPGSPPDAFHRRPSGISVNVVAQKKPENVQDIDVNSQSQGEVEQDQMKGCRRGASNGDARKKDPG